jgi:photosystem II stability/assembly factor-like uncharacterized protein
MRQLLAGTSAGILRIDRDGATAEDGPAAVAYMAAGWHAYFAVTPQGALWVREPDDGWVPVNRRPTEDDVFAFALDPRVESRMYLGVSPALVYRSDDEGDKWTACDSVRRIPGYETWTFPPPPHIPRVRSIAPDPCEAGSVYIGVEEGGVYRSPDGGESWQSLNEGLYWDVHTIVPSLEGDELYATTGAGFHRSEDGGASWRHVTTGMERRYTVPLLASRSRPGRLLTAAAAGPPPTWSGGADCALYASEDAGRSWRRVEKGLPSRFDTLVGALVEDRSGAIYAAADGAILVSEDGGQSWAVFADGLPPVRAIEPFYG